MVVKRLEASSYAPFQAFLLSIGENPVIVADGQRLPCGFLYDVLVYSKRNRISCQRGDLHMTGDEPRYVFNLSGRTDIVVLLPDKTNVSRMNTRFAIKIKSKMPDACEALSEVYLQLVGLSVENGCTSPPVLLTDLNNIHYVLYFELPDRVKRKFKLCIEQHPTLLLSIRRCRVLARRPCFTANFGYTPSPLLLTPQMGHRTGNSITGISTYHIACGAGGGGGDCDEHMYNDSEIDGYDDDHDVMSSRVLEEVED